MDFSGVRLKTIDLQLLSNQERGQVMSPFEALSAELKKELSVYYGSPFWSLDLSAVQKRILSEGWVKSVYLRRSFPEALKVQIMPKAPMMLVRSSSQWVAVDEEGAPLLISTDIPGAWTSLPMVFGLENIFDRGRTVEELKRQVADQAEILKDAHQLLAALRSRAQLEVESLQIKEESWTNEAILTVNVNLPNRNLLSAADAKAQITFLSHDWASRISALQFVLSDLSARNAASVQIMGQFQGRWIVQGLAEMQPTVQPTVRPSVKAKAEVARTKPVAHRGKPAVKAKARTKAEKNSKRRGGN